MSQDDYDFLLKTWKELCQTQNEMIESLNELVEAQSRTIYKLTTGNDLRLDDSQSQDNGMNTSQSNPNPAQYKLNGEK